MKIFYLSAILFLFALSAKCQDISPDVTNNYPLSIVMKVQDVVQAASVAASEQVPLANFFQTEANNITAAVNNNATPAQLQAVQNQLVVQFQAILTPQELALYSTNRKGSTYALVPPVSSGH